MPLIFARTARDTRRIGAAGRTALEVGPQRSLFDPTIAGRSFERGATRFQMTDDMLRERLAELDLRRRRAQIRARRALDAPDPVSMDLPFAV
jgi:hypothetical protein